MRGGVGWAGLVHCCCTTSCQDNRWQSLNDYSSAVWSTLPWQIVSLQYGYSALSHAALHVRDKVMWLIQRYSTQLQSDIRLLSTGYVCVWWGGGWEDEMRVLIGWCASCPLLMAVILAARVAHDSQQKAVYKQLPCSFPMQPTADIYVRWCCAQPIAKHALIRNYRTVNPVRSRSVRDLRE